MYKMKDYFFKWLQYYILFFDKKKKSSGDEKEPFYRHLFSFSF